MKYTPQANPCALNRRTFLKLSGMTAGVAAMPHLFERCAYAQASAISYVDTSLSGSQKFVLRVGGNPYFLASIQVRLDKLRYWWNWSAAMRDGIIGQASSDGFNTVSIPIHWYEVEPSKDNFDWTILDEYLGLVNKHNLKMELLWFSQNSGGTVQWLGSSTTPVHLRTPDYVLYSPSYGSSATTSDYTIDRSYNNYTLDVTDASLLAREVYVLGEVMAHIASWDSANGSIHPVIGVQVGNEVGGPATTAEILSYYNSVAGAVKNSSYSVWTRMNCVEGTETARINSNEALRPNTNIDFIGVDLYGQSTQNIQTGMPTIGENFKMIMEAGADASNAGLLPCAALSGDTAFNYYDMIGPDGHGLYDPSGSSWTPHGSYISLVRTVNTVLRRAKHDLSTNKKQVASTGLYVHNYRGDSTATTPGVAGVTFTPAIATSQGISVVRSSSEILVINMQGGVFNYPSSLGINGASQGYFDNNNNWVNEGNVSYSSTQITPPTATVVRLTH